MYRTFKLSVSINVRNRDVGKAEMNVSPAHAEGRQYHAKQNAGYIEQHACGKCNCDCECGAVVRGPDGGEVLRANEKSGCQILDPPCYSAALSS